MKIIIIINTILSLFAFIQLVKAFAKSKGWQQRLNRINEEDLKEVGLIYLLSPEKVWVQRAGRLILVLLFSFSFLLTLEGIDRLANKFAPYATNGIAILSTIKCIILAAVGQLTFMIYNISNLSFMKNIRI